MGLTLRNGGQGSFQVSIRPLVKTCPEENGLYKLENLPDGTKIMAIGHAFWPSHDRGVVEIVKKAIADQRPDVLIMLGGMVHEEAFKQVVDEQDEVKRLICSALLPEIAEVREEHEGLEERFLALAKKAGEFIASFAEAGAGHVIYIPSVTGVMPNEIDILRFVSEQKRKADKWAEARAKKNPQEAPEPSPEIPEAWSEFIGLKDHPNVTVLPFGAALRIAKTRFMIGDHKRRHPGTASQVDAEQFGEDVVRSFDGKVSSAWWTTPKHSLGVPVRRYWQAHEIGNLFDLTKQLGYLRNYDRRAKGIWAGTVVGDQLFGASVMVLHGRDKRRSIFLDGNIYEEDTATPRANFQTLTLPSRKEESVKESGAKKRTRTTRTKATQPRKRRSAKDKS